MIKSFTLKFSESPNTIELPGQGVTIFVGPNNSGKSLVLRELERSISNIGSEINNKIVSDFDINWPSDEEMDEIARSYAYLQPTEQMSGYLTLGRFAPTGQFESANINFEQLKHIMAQKANKNWVSNQFLRYLFIRLDGRTRFQLSDDRQTGDLGSFPQNTFAKLFVDDSLRSKIRNLIFDAFGVYFVIDPLLGGVLRIKLSAVEPSKDEQSLNLAARTFHGNATYIKDASDGVQAYVGVLTAIIAQDYKVVCIDEPEAFLHPPLARKLGTQLTGLANGRSGSLIASTHSADFLMGCVQASPDVRVVRLDYSKGKSKGRVVDPDILNKMFQDPLMRSANIISALFYDGVIITESDNDRVFYAEIYHRISQGGDNFPSILFVNAQNKQTIKNIMEPLRKFGVPAAAIVDIDVLKDGGSVWRAWLQAAQIPIALHDGYASQRDSIRKCFDNTLKDMKKDGGISALSCEDKQAAEALFDVLDKYGVFAVRGGELESWLSSLRPVGQKKSWVVSMLDKMGNDPQSNGYVRPFDGDVWNFVSNIIGWIKNSDRKGT